MNWEQKLEALNAITVTNIKMRKPGDWYVSANRREIKDGPILYGEYGNGNTPEEAVNNDWEIMTNIPENKEILIDAMGNRQSFRWNGYRWIEK